MIRLASLYCFLTIFAVGFLAAQSQDQYLSYQGISPENKNAIFYEGFEDNRHKWDLGQEDSSWIENIINGNLLFEAIDELAKEDYISFEIDQKKDFEIEASIKFIKGNEAAANGLQWGKSENSQFDFMFNGNGQITIDRFSGEFYDYLPFTPVVNYNPDGYNKLTIRKYKDEYCFFFNEVLVHQMPFKPFFGDNIGFQVGGKSTIQVDYLRISEIIQVHKEPELASGLEASVYHALLIGIDHYEDPGMNDLDQPVKDAKSMYNLLKTEYTFDTSNIRLLIDPTYEEIIASLDQLIWSLDENDNLLIFYAGHGYWEEKTGIGYWLPTDARQTNTANWFRNSTLKDYIAGIKTKHTLLISDACFGGAIFKTRKAFSDLPMAIEKLYLLNSRKAMTSGTLEEVPDKSIFIEYLIKRLSENQEKYISSEQLFSNIRTAVLNNSPNIPQYGEIKETGDEGGDFIFIRRIH